jgi:hypothetical protein
MEERICFAGPFISEEMMIPLRLCSLNREMAGRFNPNHSRGLQGIASKFIKEGGDWQGDSRSKGQKMAKWEHHKPG